MATDSTSSDVNTVENCNSTDNKNNNMDVANFSQVALRSIMDLIMTSNEVFSGKEDYDFCNSFKKFRDVVSVETSGLKDMMSKILNQHCLKVNLDKIDVEEMFDAIVEANDIILERVGVATDEAIGHRKIEDPILITAMASKNINTSWNRKRKHDGKSKSSTFHLLTAKNILRPQLGFKDKIDNSSEPFVPIIKEKPHSLKPLAIILEQTEYGEMYSHPYHCELDHFKPTEAHLCRAELKPSKPLKDTPLIYVDDVVQLKDLLNDLKSQSEIAVDLEHHSYRSFQGITCLMQISTREKDFIIDTLKLRSELFILNEVFADPKILKVFHGADKDIEWLQRDFGVYVVNMFDTGQASRVLSFAHFSLAFLLKHYCHVDSNKCFQLADWRIRPLPEEMINYARDDTHYLLYIYDCMKNELLDKGNLEKNLLLSVYQRSKLVCQKRYVKTAFNPDGYQALCKKSCRVLNSQQLYALKELYAWRDKVARQEDESIGYVLPNHMLLQIAEVLPREIQGILACCNPIPTLIRQSLNEIHQIILCAREQSLVKPVTQQLQIQVDKSRHHVDLENVFHCPHDFSHLKDMESIDTGPTLLDLWNKFGDDLDVQLEFKISSNIIIKKAPIIPELINDNKVMSNNKARRNISNVTSVFSSYNSPFDRYKLVKPLLGKDISDKSSVDTNLSNNEDKSAMEVKEHFMQLLQIHGHKKTDQTAKNLSSLSEDTIEKEQPQSYQSAASQSIQDSDYEPVRKKFKIPGRKKKQKRKTTQSMNECGTDEAVSVPKKKNRIEVDEANFQPFDYSKTDSSFFKGGANAKKKSNKKHFDPDRSVPEYKTGSKPKKNLKDKLKSLTYRSKKSVQGGSSSKQKPKR